MSLKTAFIAASIAFVAGPVQAQTPAPAPFPNKPLRFIVPFPAGGTLDVLARTVSNELGSALGQTVVVENRPGASGVLGAELVAHAPADGHTLVICSNTLVTLPAMRNDLPFDVFNDFAPVIELGGTPTVITVHPSFPARDLKQFIEAAKKTKGGVNYNSPGIASPLHAGSANETASAPAKAEELCIEVAALLAPGGPGTLDQQGLEPQVTLTQPGGTALASTLIVAWTQPGPRQEMSRSREPAHVAADLRQDDPR